MKCEDCGIWLKDATHPRWPDIIGLCMFDNCCQTIPHHIRYNSKEECSWGIERSKNENNSSISGTID